MKTEAAKGRFPLAWQANGKAIFGRKWKEGSNSDLTTKNKTFLLNQNMTCSNYGIYVATCVIPHEQCVSTRDGHRTAPIGINVIATMTTTNRPYHDTSK